MVSGQWLAAHSSPGEVLKLLIPSKVVLGQRDPIRKNIGSTLPHTIPKIDSKWIADLTMEGNTVQLLKNNIGEHTHDL